MTVAELRKKAKELGITGTSNMLKMKLERVIEEKEKEIKSMKKIGFDEFVEMVVSNIKEVLPPMYRDKEIKVQDVLKNNGTVKGLIIPGETNVTPTIYMEYFYEMYLNGKTMKEVIEKIAEFRVQAENHEEIKVDEIMSFNACQRKIVCRIYSSTSPYLENKITKKFAGDLAIMYSVELSNSPNGDVMSTAVTMDLMEKWGVDIADIHAAAMLNMAEQDYSLKSMFEVMSEMTGVDPSEMGLEDDNRMYVLTNKNKVCGASSILNRNAIEEIKEKIGETFYILPSSVHELLIIKDDGKVTVDDLKNMVRDVNDTQVDPVDRLSYSVYYYNGNEVVIA